MNTFFYLQVAALRRRMLQDLQKELKKVEGALQDADMRRNFGEHFSCIRTPEQTLTVKEIETAKRGLQQFVRLIFCLH